VAIAAPTVVRKQPVEDHEWELKSLKVPMGKCRQSSALAQVISFTIQNY